MGQILSIVQGNNFGTAISIQAVDAQGHEIQDFSLEDSTEVHVWYVFSGKNVDITTWSIENGKVVILWPKDLTLGSYDIFVDGVYSSAAWRNAMKSQFRIVKYNYEAYIPDDVIVLDGIYQLSAEMAIITRMFDNRGTPSDTTPNMDGEAEVGTEERYARGDHRHPSDTSKQDVIDAFHKLSADNVEDANTTNKFVTSAEKAEWNGKYTKPATGIPASDLANGVIPDVSQFITKTVNDLVNYYTKSQTYTQAEVQQLINAVKQFTYVLVSTLPTASASTMNKIYLVPSSNPQTQNIKDEYITLESSGSYSWEQIGSTAIDLSGYVTTQALNAALANYITTASIVNSLNSSSTDKPLAAAQGKVLNEKISPLVREMGETNGQTLTGVSCDFVGDFKTGELIAVKTVQSGSPYTIIYGFRSDGTSVTVISDLKAGNIYFLQIPEDFVKIRVYSSDSGKVATLWAGNDTISSVSNGERSIATANRARTTFSYNSASTGTFVDRRTLLRTGDVIRLRAPQNQSGRIVFQLLKRLNGNYVATGALQVFSGNMSAIASLDFEVPSDEYDYVRFYFQDNISSPFSFSIEVVPGESAEDGGEYSYSATNKTETGTIFEQSVKISRGDCLLYSVSGSNITMATIYYIKSGGNQNIYMGSPSSEPVTDVYSTPANDDYTSVRLYINSATTPYDVSISFVVIPAIIADIIQKMNSIGLVTEDDLKMCLPDKVFAVKGISYNIYKSSIMLSPNKRLDMFTYPYGTTNPEADLIQIGEVCKLDNLKGTTLRVGLRDYLDMEHRIIHKDLPVVWNDVAAPISKLVNIMGDSITNRGAGYFSALAASSIGCTINGFGTMTNSGSFKGEGREGWTFGNFIGESNICGSGTITPQDAGTSGSLTKNPFLRVATATDYANNPQWCFPSTGAQHETPYSEDSSAGTYYIFDYAAYLARWSNANIPDVVTIALGTNDSSRYTDAEIKANARWMVSQIVAEVPAVKIGIIPPGPMTAPDNSTATRFFSIAEALKAEFSADANVNIVGLWAFMSRFFAFGLGTTTAINASTDSSVLSSNVHFDGGDASDKRSYIEYGRVLASFILTQ